MPELRWTLLIIGALFIVGLALWEFRRQRQAPRSNAGSRGAPGADRVPPSLDTGADSARGHGGGTADGSRVPADGPRVYREPTISFPELHPELHPEPSVDARVEPRLGATRPREPAPDLPVVEVDDAAFARLRAKAESDGAPLDFDLTEFSEPQAAAADGSSTPDLNDAAEGAAPLAALDESASLQANAANPRDEATAAFRSDDASTGFVSDNDHDIHGTDAAASHSSAQHEHPAGATSAGEPVVDWPGEESRKIVALRLVSHPASRFQGRAVRQALAAEGFVLGKFDIFHKPGPDDRAVLSAASLTKPGTFAMNTIDAQRFGGISLFAVLPGPLPPQETFDELLITARNLNDRLQGALQDERGEPLTPTRSATIRQSLSDDETRQ